jgi:heme/copper-type cytochrome/quinol oxidase subunit 2
MTTANIAHIANVTLTIIGVVWFAVVVGMVALAVRYRREGRRGGKSFDHHAEDAIRLVRPPMTQWQRWQ